MWCSPNWARVPRLCGHISWVWWQCRSTEIRRQTVCQHSSKEQVKHFHCSAITLKPGFFPHRKHIQTKQGDLSQQEHIAPLAVYVPCLLRREKKWKYTRVLPSDPTHQAPKEDLSLSLSLSDPQLPDGFEVSLSGYWSAFEPQVMLFQRNLAPRPLRWPGGPQ